VRISQNGLCEGTDTYRKGLSVCVCVYLLHFANIEGGGGEHSLGRPVKNKKKFVILGKTVRLSV